MNKKNVLIGLGVVFIVYFAFFSGPSVKVLKTGTGQGVLEDWERETLSTTDQWEAKERERKEAARKAEEERSRAASAQREQKNSGPSSGGSASSGSGSSPGMEEKPSSVYVTVESGGVFSSVELDNYTVKITKTNKLNGDVDYETGDEQTGDGSWFGNPAQFYYKNYGYYEVESSGYSKSREKVYHIKYSNIKHSCETITFVTIYADGNTMPRVNCP
jgi:hypothetical protein